MIEFILTLNLVKCCFGFKRDFRDVYKIYYKMIKDQEYLKRDYLTNCGVSN